MKIRTISVRGLFGTFDHFIDVRDEGLTFIHARNGLGKSTTFRLIYDLFRGDLDSAREVPFDSVSAEFTEGVSVTVTNGHPMTIISTRNGVESELTPQELNELYNSIYISPERTFIREADGRYIPALDTYVEEFDSMLKRTLADNRLTAPENVMEEMDDGDFIFWCMNLKARIDFISDIGLTIRMPNDISFPPSRYEYNENKERYMQVMSSVSEWVDRNYPIAEATMAYLDIMNRLFINKKVIIDEDHRLAVELISGIRLPIDRLSAGEKHLMIIFYRLLFDTYEDTLAIIDEPEISLHVSWQQKLAELFLDISRIKKIQILVATHSPQIIHDRWDLATELRARRA